MTLRSSRCLSSLGRLGCRRISGVSGVAAGVEDSAPSGRGLAAFAKAAVGILAVGGSSLGLWFLPESEDTRLANSSDPRLYGCREASAVDKNPRFLFGGSFRRRVFFKYEKRLRLQSSPEKIFEYFASIRSPEGEVFMSPADLMRAVIPVFPSSESSIVKEGCLRGEQKPGVLHCASSPLFLLFDTNNDGLISFPEYIFFVTLLSIPDSSFSVAFKMFDLDNNGSIERDEFKKVMALMRSYNRQGACHRNGLRIGLKIRGSVENAGLVEYFFGKDGNDRLQHDKFVKFLRDLHDEILRLEFDHYDVKSEGTISAKDFALSMVAAADINHINKFLDRVDVLDKDLHLKDMRITFEEFKAFADLRKRLDLLSFAIFSYGKVNGFFAKEDFNRAASHVCGVSLSDNVVDVVFHVFDSNNDGHLSSEEFLRVMQKREIDVRQPTSASRFRHSFMLP
ncbi:calcium uptake protein, mitochondrial [Phalaenopsis equestris]|uniref:calcium uptake protein, mitochondrial n=1 Tax=Phalaenopsis equestris TaxID=78828 RepID=UPI0009E40406|nr:calcium uptake protein, mitochondrial [Phalaenopsis equestris]